MKLEKIKIEGLRKIKNTTIVFGNTTFIIGENNVGKSTIFEGIRLLLTNTNPSDNDFTRKYDEETKANLIECDTIKITGTFSDLPEEANEWIGFKGRVFKENENLKVIYRKTFKIGQKPIIEMYEKKKELKEEIFDGKKITIDTLIAFGIDEEILKEHFDENLSSKNLNIKEYLPKFESISEVWNYSEDFDWVVNPGGIPQNVISKLPKYICIPAEHRAEEICDNKQSALGDIMNTIFDDVVESSTNYVQVKNYFSELEKEIDTENEETEFGKIMIKVNETIKTVFPDSSIYAKVNLSDPNTFLKPKYDILLGSNIFTNVSYQGTGMIRTTAFSLLKFRETWKQERGTELRSLIICFEEPEIFLHPNAANQLRNTIYELGASNNQIICTTHSPYMIDLSRTNENQILNNMTYCDDGFVIANAFNTSSEFENLVEDDKTHVKMLLKIDDYIARVFFCKKVIIVEGDTEDVVLTKSLDLINANVRNKIMSECQIIKARGKATIPPLIKYLKAMGINNIFVIHDRDNGKQRAMEVNPRIIDALDNNEDLRIMLEENIENTLGYEEPSKDKPYRAFVEIQNWDEYSNIPVKWREVLEKAFHEYL